MNMKVMGGLMAILAVIYFAPALLRMQGSHTLNGSTIAQLNRSAKDVRRNMPTEERNLFDTAFGILNKIKSEEGPDAFAQAVDGKTPDEVVELAKHEVDSKIAAGDAEFKPYTSWGDMISKITADPNKKATAMAPLRQSERTGRPN
jgi:hypothetical protein